jgi:hypothetical protein
MRYQVRPISHRNVILVLCKFWMQERDLEMRENGHWYAFLNDTQRRKLRKWCNYYGEECVDVTNLGSWVKVVPSVAATGRLFAKGLHTKRRT